MASAFPKSGPVTLKTNLAEYPTTRALKSGEVSSPLVEFDFCGPKVAYQGFKPMVREGAFDAGELAIVTYLLAKAYGKPLVLLPAPVLSRFQHNHISYNTSRGEMRPKDIEGRRVAVRSYTVTTGVWLRGILQHDYGVDPNRVTWMTQEEAHLEEFRDPPNVERLPDPKKELERVLLDGEADAAILRGPMTNEPAARTLIPDPEAAARAWHKKYGVVSVNHWFVVSKALADARPDVVEEIYRLLLESKKKAPTPAGGIDMFPFGVEANRKGLELIVQYAFEQKIIPRRFAVDELFDDTARRLA